MSREASAIVVPTHGCKSDFLREPYFVCVFVHTASPSRVSLHLPAVVDDFGDLVIVRGPL